MNSKFLYLVTLMKIKCLEFPPAPERTILVCGSGRSGTTWLGDVVAACTDSRLLFEPFLLDENKDLQLASKRKVCISARVEYPLYKAPWEVQDARFRRVLRRIIFGYYSGGWVNQDARSGIFYRRVIKEIRANLILGYIARLWPSLRIIYLVRSPFHVVDSMLSKEQKNWRFSWEPKDILGQPALISLFPSAFCQKIEKIMTLPEQLMMRWCVENFVALQHLHGLSNVLVVNYERLAKQQDWNRIEEFLQDRGWHEGRHTRFIEKPSRTTERFNKGDSSRIFSKLTQDDLNRISDMLEMLDWRNLFPYQAGERSALPVRESLTV